MQETLGSLFQSALSESSIPDVHDRALLYYRLITRNAGACRQIITSKDSSSMPFSTKASELDNQLFSEMNTLGVVYRKLASTFVSDGYMLHHTDLNDHFSSLGFGGGDSEIVSGHTNSGDLDSFLGASSTVSVPPTNAAPTPSGDLLGDLFGFSSPSTVTATKTPEVNQITLVKGAVLDPSKFQSLWVSLPGNPVVDYTRGLPIPGQKDIESLAASGGIGCIASGDMGDAFKFYFYGVDTLNNTHLSEVILNKNNGKGTITMKTTGTVLNGQSFVDLLKNKVGGGGSSVGGGMHGLDDLFSF